MNKLLWKLKQLFNKEEFKHYAYDEKDIRNFGSSSYAGIITRADIPTEDFIVFNPVNFDQQDYDDCVGCSAAFVKEPQEGMIMSGIFAFAMAKRASGTIQGFGTSPIQVCKGLTKYGICERSYWQQERGRRDYYTNWNNIPQTAYDNALLHKAGSYFELESERGIDTFDIILAHLWKLRDKKMLVMTGALGHAITPIGRKTINGVVYLVSKDSYDRPSMSYQIGRYEPGTCFRYFTRQEVNGYFFTPLMVTDMPRTTAEVLQKYNGKAVKGSGDKCYLITGGQRHHLLNKETAWCYGIRLWEDIITITDEELNLVPEGDVLVAVNGQFHGLVNEIINTQDKHL